MPASAPAAEVVGSGVPILRLEHPSLFPILDTGSEAIPSTGEEVDRLHRQQVKGVRLATERTVCLEETSRPVLGGLSEGTQSVCTTGLRRSQAENPESNACFEERTLHSKGRAFHETFMFDDR